MLFKSFQYCTMNHGCKVWRNNSHDVLLAEGVNGCCISYHPRNVANLCGVWHTMLIINVMWKSYVHLGWTDMKWPTVQLSEQRRQPSFNFRRRRQTQEEVESSRSIRPRMTATSWRTKQWPGMQSQHPLPQQWWLIMPYRVPWIGCYSWSLWIPAYMAWDRVSETTEIRVKGAALPVTHAKPLPGDAFSPVAEDWGVYSWGGHRESWRSSSYRFSTSNAAVPVADG